jgi:hypothetical protein
LRKDLAIISGGFNRLGRRIWRGFQIVYS